MDQSVYIFYAACIAAALYVAALFGVLLIRHRRDKDERDIRELERQNEKIYRLFKEAYHE